MILAIIASCSPLAPAGETPPAQKLIDIPFETLSQETPLGDQPAEAHYAVVATREGWDSLDGLFPQQAVEVGRLFDGYDASLIVAVFAGVKGSSGYSIQIETVMVGSGGEVFVQVSETHPGADQIVEPAKTLPYHLAIVSREYFLEVGTLVFAFIDRDGRELSTAEVRLP